MRQRKAKNMEERMAALGHYLIEKPEAYKGSWMSAFEQEGPLYLELGCGKGQFLISRAQSSCGVNLIGIEGQDSVLLRALEKANAAEIANIRFVHMFVRDVRDLFEDGELSGIYLNFSDPWPKARHAKRRLTYGEYLLRYKQILTKDGFIAVKTDNDDLFDFTLEEAGRVGLEIKEMTRDLHNSDYPARKRTTEYEDKFRAAGKTINYVLL